MPCQKCATYKKFIQAMIAEFNKYGSNKTAQYYKGQCEKVIDETGLTAPTRINHEKQPT